MQHRLHVDSFHLGRVCAPEIWAQRASTRTSPLCRFISLCHPHWFPLRILRSRSRSMARRARGLAFGNVEVGGHHAAIGCGAAQRFQRSALRWGADARNWCPWNFLATSTRLRMCSSIPGPYSPRSALKRAISWNLAPGRPRSGGKSSSSRNFWLHSSSSRLAFETDALVHIVDDHFQ